MLDKCLCYDVCREISSPYLINKSFETRLLSQMMFDVVEISGKSR